MIQFEKTDLILNGKGEWGMNLVPQLKPHSYIQGLSQGEMNTTSPLSVQVSQLDQPNKGQSESAKRFRDDRRIANHNASDSNHEFTGQFQQRKRMRKQRESVVDQVENPGRKGQFGEASLVNSQKGKKANQQGCLSFDNANTMRNYFFSFTDVLKTRKNQS